MSSPVRQVIDGAIKANKVMVFSKSYCPYCTRAKQAITQAGEKFGVIELDVDANGSAIQDELLAMTGQRTVPNVFVNGKHLGGCDNTLAAISSGKFRTMLSDV